jgi:hypothetical protein
VVAKGETNHEIGRDGVRKARLWLDSTLMASVQWISGTAGDNKLRFDRADGKETFTFDLGGLIMEPGQASGIFMGECKHRRDTGLGTEFRQFLAQCYLAESINSVADYFLWISFTPFLMSDWQIKESVDYIERAVDENESIALGGGTFDSEIAERVSHKLITVVLSDQQIAKLSLGEHELIEVQQALIKIRSRSI